MRLAVRVFAVISFLFTCSAPAFAQPTPSTPALPPTPTTVPVGPGMKIVPQFHPVRPPFLPAQLHWRPRKNFGPFKSGSDLSKIQMLLRSSGAQLFHNDYFSTFLPSEASDLD